MNQFQLKSLFFLSNAFLSTVLTTLNIFLAARLKSVWAKRAAVFSSVNLALISVHLLIFLGYTLLFASQTVMLLQALLRMLLAADIFLVPAVVHCACVFRIRKAAELLFFSLAFLSAVFDLFLRTKIVYCALGAAAGYTVVLSLVIFLRGNERDPLINGTLRYAGILLLFSLPFLTADVMNDLRFPVDFHPFTGTGFTFFPFFFSACMLLLFRSLLRLDWKKTAETLRVTTDGERPETNPPAALRGIFSMREREVYDLLIRGSRNKETASALGISESTVKKHARSIFRKAEVGSRLQLITAIENGTVSGASLPLEFPQNSPGGPYKSRRRRLTIDPKSSPKEIRRMKRKLYTIVTAALVAVSVPLSLIVGSCISRRPPGETVEVEPRDVSWSFSSLIARDEGYENEDSFWTVSDPQSEGIDDLAVRTHLELCIRMGADALLVAHGNRIVCEWYSARYDSPMGAMSSTKSVASLLTGMLQDRGLLAIDDPIGRYLPGWNEGLRGEVTIRNLLTMTGGFSQQSSPEKSVGYTAEKNAFVLALEPESKPGSVWAYSNEGVQLLSPILDGILGGGLKAFAEDTLFRPVGMLRSSMRTSGAGNDVWTYADMLTTPRDFARLGRLVLSGGTWNGGRIIGSEYLTEMLTPCDEAEYYGLLWWLYDSAEGPAGWGTEGYLDTDMYVFPDYDLVVVRMQAPKEAYSGEPESGDYQKDAWYLFPAFVDPKLSHRSYRVLGKIAADDADPAFAAALDAAVADSREGLVDPVIKRLEPFIDSGTGTASQRAQALMTLALAYIRIRNYRTAAGLLVLVDEKSLVFLPDFWGQNYRELQKMIDEGPK